MTWWQAFQVGRCTEVGLRCDQSKIFQLPLRKCLWRRGPRCHANSLLFDCVRKKSTTSEPVSPWKNALCRCSTNGDRSYFCADEVWTGLPSPGSQFFSFFDKLLPHFLYDHIHKGTLYWYVYRCCRASSYWEQRANVNAKLLWHQWRAKGFK